MESIIQVAMIKVEPEEVIFEEINSNFKSEGNSNSDIKIKTESEETDIDSNQLPSSSYMAPSKSDKILNFKTSNMTDLSTHNQQLHDGKPVRSCFYSDCNFKATNSKKLRYHVKMHTQVLMCCYCRFQAKGKVSLMQHFRKNHRNQFRS